jgi:short-subunit dehydrogenase
MPASQLSQKTAIVTGASRGFGRAIATSFVSHGAHVVGVARTEAQLEDLREQLGDSFSSRRATPLTWVSPGPGRC